MDRIQLPPEGCNVMVMKIIWLGVRWFPMECVQQQEQLRVMVMTFHSTQHRTVYREGYLGCFVDVIADRVLSGNNLVTDPDMTISYCIQYCNESTTANYVYAGVENRNECYCGEASDNYSKYGVGTDANCQTPCSGDPTESCGGSGYIAVFRVNIQSPTTPGVGSTDSMQIMTLSPASASASASPPVMTTMGTSQVPPRNGDNQNNTGLYAGVAGGVVAIVIIVVIVIVVVLLMRKRSRRQQKDGLQSHDMTVMQPASPNGTQDNLYHDMFQDNSDETPHGLQLPDPPTDGDVTYYSSVRDHALPEGDATSYSSVKDQKSKNTDSKLNNTMPSDQNDGFPEKRVSRPPPNGDVEAMYAMPDKPRKSQGEEDFGSLYAKPDKTGKGGDGQGSEDFGALYAMPDKSRGVPEGREDVNQVGPESEGNSGEGLYSLADDDTGLYAMSTAPGHTVSNDDNEYGTVMVDNELYAM
ncbi:uncharacterized protein LOC100888657 isoform X2 [Strongylocentrotus purpuratus]|uniref:WSC domain-containing protein n=1 Tax=Strongylocentrotus purpuratus TaxID=7668 RepID=A0A7M7NNQ0_STRPU|nr:uncharacterized protein LOC100888657 isoform X2 [Strongylocentrotus purpuratus]